MRYPQPRHWEAIRNWTALNNFLLTAKLDDCQTLLEMEQKGEMRPTFLRRIKSRIRVARKIQGLK